MSSINWPSIHFPPINLLSAPHQGRWSGVVKPAHQVDNERMSAAFDAWIIDDMTHWISEQDAAFQGFMAAWEMRGGELDALAAHADRLKSALNYSNEYLNKDALNSIGHGSKAHMEMMDALCDSPSSSRLSGGRHDTTDTR